MSAEAGDGCDAQVPGLVYGGEDADEVVRLRRENARLRRQLVAKEREREHLIARYEALLPDGAERPAAERATEGRVAGGRAAGGRAADDRQADASRSGGGSRLARVRRLLPARLRG